jgi:hypothetical protein
LDTGILSTYASLSTINSETSRNLNQPTDFADEPFFFSLLSGCSDKGKIDQSVINRLENGVAGYKKILLDLQNAGLSKDEFKKKWNDANFALRDAISFLEARKKYTTDLNPITLNQTADRWVDLLEAYQFPTEKKWVSAIAQSNIDETDQVGWNEPYPHGFETCLSMPLLMRLMKYFPHLRLRKHDMQQYMQSGLNPELPENIQKEILAYVPTEAEPIGFLRHFGSYCRASIHGFSISTNGLRYFADFRLNKSDLNSAIIPALKSEIDNLDSKLKVLTE